MTNRRNVLRRARIAGTAALLACGVSGLLAAARGLPPDEVLPDLPLVARAAPNVALDLAPGVASLGAAYRDAFAPARPHAGYWDPMGCYDYLPAEALFRRVVGATVDRDGSIGCVDRWSGNLLNWAAMSTLDGLRLALTGGDRAVDEPGHTVLQRGSVPPAFYRADAFPDKGLVGHLDRLTPLVADFPALLRAGDTLHFNSCLGRLMVGAGAAGRCTDPGDDQRFGPGKKAGSYAARVEVCTPSDVLSRPGLCTTYSPGKAKPVGLVQAHAPDLRFAVFGHAPDDDSGRSRGFLRVALKQVGSTQVDARLDSADNPQAEWNAGNGVFKTDVAGGSVVLAINRFGRGGADGDFDAGSAVFGDSLRYLQGPALPDPEVCRANQVVLVGDAAAADGPMPGGSPLAAPAVPPGDSPGDLSVKLPGNPVGYRSDPDSWTRLVAAFERHQTLAYTHPSGKAGLTTDGNMAPPAPAGSNAGYAMAGLAWWARTQQFRVDQPEARVRTAVLDVGRPAGMQRPNGLALAARYGGFDDSNDDGNPFRQSDGPGRRDVPGNAEWAEGLADGGALRPAGYFAATEPQAVRAALRRMLLRAALPGDTGGMAGALSGDRIGSAAGSVRLFVPRSDARHMAGTLLAFDPTPGADGNVQWPDAPAWDAGRLLTGSATATPPLLPRDPASRRIFTLSPEGVGVPFEWGALDAATRRSLDATPYAEPPASDQRGPERVAWLRGDRRLEQSTHQGIFRVRTSVMGDIGNASPLFVPGHRGGVAAVYVGANDGMVHAFAADSGEELFAYVPRSLASRLGGYSSPDAAHRALVDGALAAADVSDAEGRTRTVLVGGHGAGATGVFALDVSQPQRFSDDKVLWTFTGADDPDMGFLTHAPRLLRFRTSAAFGGVAARYRWFAVVPSGFNNAHPQKRVALFLLAVDKPAGTPWRLGVDYHKVLLPRAADISMVNALGPPGDVVGDDDATRLLYAGDTQGNLWKFDFAADAPWSEGNVLAFNGHALMHAQDEDGRRQPITVAPEVGIVPGGDAIVLFGTGKFSGPADLGSASYTVQSLYGVVDDGTPIPAGRSRLQLERRKGMDGRGGRLVVDGAPFVHGNDAGGPGARRGWFFDLPDSLARGERQVSPLVLDNGLLFFNTLIPGTARCGDTGGGRSCAVDALSGLSRGDSCVASTAGRLGAPLLVALGSGVQGAADGLGRRKDSRRLAVIHVGGGRGAGIGSAEPLAPGSSSRFVGRLNWRQVGDMRRGNP